jgi:predicted nucleic acid-binding protein
VPAYPDPYDRVLLVADTSVWIEMRKRSTRGDAKQRFQIALRRDQIVSSPIVRLELYKGARSKAELAELDDRIAVAEELPMSPGIASVAVQAVRELATEGASGFHQLPVCDVLIAATARAHNLGVLTVDWNDYPKLAEVLRIPLYHPLDPRRVYLPED